MGKRFKIVCMRQLGIYLIVLTPKRHETKQKRDFSKYFMKVDNRHTKYD